MQHVLAPARKGDSPLTRTPHICYSHCDRWHIHHWKEPSIEVRHEPQCRGMLASDSLFMNVGQYGLTFKAFFMWFHILCHGTRSSDNHYCVNFIWEQWMEMVTAVLYKLQLNLSAYCVGVQWLLTHTVHRYVTKASTCIGITPWYKLPEQKVKNMCFMYLLTFHKLIWSVDGSVAIVKGSSVGHKLPSPLSRNPIGKWIRYKSTYSTCRAVSDCVKNFSTDSARFPIAGSWKWKLLFINHTKHYSPYDITGWCFRNNVRYVHYLQCFYYCTELISICLVI